jgi:excisionase family DNA binding protein
MSAFDTVTNWLSMKEAAELLGISSGKLHRLIEQHFLFAVKHNGELKIPAEVIVDGEPLASLRGTILVLLDAGLKIDEAASWLYTPAVELGGTPIASLLQGHKAPVRRLAQALAL